MRKLILPLAAILACMTATGTVVWRLSQPPAAALASVTEGQPLPIQPPIHPQWGQPVELATVPRSGQSPQPVAAPVPTPPRNWRPIQPGAFPSAPVPTGAPAARPGSYSPTASPNVRPIFPPSRSTAPVPSATPVVTEMLGQPGIGFETARPLEPAAQFAQGYEQRPDQPAKYQLATSLQLTGNYSDVIGPDEDLLQGAGITPPAGSGSAGSAGLPPAQPAPAPSMLPPTQPAPSMLPPTQPAPAPAPSMLPPTQSAPAPVPAPSTPSVLPPSGTSPPAAGTQPAPPANLPATPANLPAPPEPAKPISPPDSPAAPEVPSLGGPWSKDTAPFPDEDLLQGEIGDLPAPSGNGAAADGDGSVGSLPEPKKANEAADPSIPQQAPPPSPFTTSAPKGPAPPAKGLNPHAGSSKGYTPPEEPGVDPHLEIYAKNCFPSAKECKTCHEEIYEEWAGSSHAYASISPMFQKFEQTIHALSMGTISHFCMRCHAPVATALAHPREASIWDSVPAAREGVTCIACHRVYEDYGKVNGERRVEMGDIHQPMYGAGYGQKLAEMIENKSTYKIKTEPGEKGPGQDIHTKVIHFDQISDSSFCVSCHQVAVAPGIALEVVWAQYRASPACKDGITCQECHMGREPGVAAGYTTGPVAVVNGKEISPFRKHSNHKFYGPGYSIAHPGLFPLEPKAEEWSVQEWLQFDYRQGWGTEKFEELVDDEKIKVVFPSVWDNADDRADAREIVDKNLEKLEAKRHMRHRLMENGSHLEGPIFAHEPIAGRPLRFRYDVTNTNPGHNMPSGSLGAQPQVWLNVVLTGPGGQHLWESGYVDRNGDLADLHSLEVAAGRIRRDFQLFNLQTKFLITGIKGTDREMFLPINTDFDQLPFIRESSFPVTVMNHPPLIRMEAHSVPPLGTFQAKYRVPAKLVQQPGVYRLSTRMRSRAEPIYFMRFCKATPEMERNMNHWMLDYHEESFQFEVRGVR